MNYNFSKISSLTHLMHYIPTEIWTLISMTTDKLKHNSRTAQRCMVDSQRNKIFHSYEGSYDIHPTYIYLITKICGNAFEK